MRVGVSGVGGGSGQGIIKALKMASFDKKMGHIDIFPADVQPNSAGLYTCKYPGKVLSKPEEDIQPWIEWAKEMQLDAIIPGADRDLAPFSAFKDEFPCKVLVSKPNQVMIGDDKFETAIWLLEHKFDLPHSSAFDIGQVRRWAATMGEEYSYPCVIKPRHDAASRGFHVCMNEEDIVYHAAHIFNPVVQEYLEGEEYTCSVFVEKTRKVAATCILKRSLYAGNTYQCELVEDTEIDALIRRIAFNFAPLGALNIQLKRTPAGRIVPFEFNVRCSGSTGIRAYMGYNDPKMLLQHYVLGESIPVPEMLPFGTICYRFFDELYLPNAQAQHGKIPSWL